MDKLLEPIFPRLGKAIFLANIIEYELRNYIAERLHFRLPLASSDPLTLPKIRDLKLEAMIELLPPDVSHNSNFRDGLTQLRHIRNKLAHEIIIELYKDVVTESGSDQVAAFLDEIIQWEHLYWAVIRNQRKAVRKDHGREYLVDIHEQLFHRERLREGRVSDSKCAAHLAKLQEIGPP